MSLKILLAFAIIIFSSSLRAQFALIGDAEHMPGSCIQLTPDYDYREGIAYSTSYLNLQNYFEIEFDIYLGDKDVGGADGITFVIHNDPRGFQAYGTYGECMGYGRWSPYYDGGNFIAPSIAIEFDTYQNLQQNDPASDHVAYLENGVSLHATHWNDDNDDYNLEDGRLHNFRFRWNPNNKNITVLLDNKVVFEGTKDLVNDIFDGETKVIWGFTASTGRAYNLQYFCFRRLALNNLPAIHPVQKSQREIYSEAP
ncbi:MAG: L-type lectin-domain containing protein [Bacteroidetes bacterium]|nr:L-type lectin-domain containing protein [Bacteroidota bacterium]